MAHYTTQQLEDAVRSFEPNIFARDDDLWKPAQARIREKMAAALIGLGHTVEGYEDAF